MEKGPSDWLEIARLIASPDAHLSVEAQEAILNSLCALQPTPTDPDWPALTAARVSEDITAFSGLLDSAAPEREIHRFLEAHGYFFSDLLRLDGPAPIYSKVRLGCQHEVDFAFFSAGSYGPDWHFVEIESPSQRLFTHRGDPSAALNHAIQQVRSWHAWVHRNLDYCQHLMPHIEYPMGYVFIGRRSELDSDTRSKLKRLAHDYRATLRIHTLDWFLRSAISVRDSLPPSGRQRMWPIRAQAYSHVDMAIRRPKDAWNFLLSPDAAAQTQLYPEFRAALHLRPCKPEWE